MTIAEQIYQEHVQMLPMNEQLRLISLVTQSLANTSSVHTKTVLSRTTHADKHSIMELHGLGAETWQGVDAQTYVDELRDEWEREIK
jgi:deoxycytidylate deaminase